MSKATLAAMPFFMGYTLVSCWQPPVTVLAVPPIVGLSVVCGFLLYHLLTCPICRKGKP